MEGLLNEIEKRRAKRALSDRKIPEETIRRLMIAATYAPSCFNHQSWRFLVLTEEEPLKMAHEALSGGNYWAKKAPLLLLVVTKPDLDCRLNDRRDYALFDCGLATENLILQAGKEGLYAHPMAGFEPLKVKEAFKIPEEYIVITLVAIGYPGEDHFLNEKHRELEVSPRERKPDSEVICYNAWEFETPEPKGGD